MIFTSIVWIMAFIIVFLGDTLLEAVRYKGFIPWDDGVGIMFDRMNYEKFFLSFSSNPIVGYEVISNLWVNRLTKDSNPLKVDEELCIDLFVFDSVPSNKLQAKFKVFVIKMFQGMLKAKPEYKRFSNFYKCLLFITWILGRLFSQKTVLVWFSFSMGKNLKK